MNKHAIMVKATLGWLYGPTPNVQNAIDILEALLKEMQETKIKEYDDPKLGHVTIYKKEK